MRDRSILFERATVRAEDEPGVSGPRVVFVGRSNVGKSSLINRLFGVKGLAKTSSKPGRTQTVNFYRVDGAWHVVDLPGYGFAAVPERVRRAWAPMIEGFLERSRQAIALTVVVVDARRPPTSLDATMRGWLEEREIPFAVAATKADKLSGNGRAAARRALADWPAILVSSETGFGIGELWRRIEGALEERKT